MQRSTKIVATLGPSSSDAHTLERMFAAGVDVVRLNFSHGTADDHMKRAELVRECCRKVDRAVGIMAVVQLGRTLDDATIGSIVSFLESLTGDVPAHYAPPGKKPTM